VPRRTVLALLIATACGDGTEGRAPITPAPLETGIARELTARFGVPVTATCAWLAGMPLACRAVLPDATVLPVALSGAGPAWDWRIPGRVVAVAPIAAYVQASLADLGIAQTASCGPSVQRLAPGARITCALSGGGVAFVDVTVGGEVSLELALDPATAMLRRAPISDRELVGTSRALEHLGGEEDDPVEVPGDGGTP
jgi:hypothetical protein